MQRHRTKQTRAARVLGAAAAMAITVLPQVSAAAVEREVHCVVRVVGREADGRLRTTPASCAPTPSGALQASGAAASDWAIGRHYDGPGLTGSSFTVVGSSCVGGWLNLPPEWINRVSSTLHGCPRIRHFDGYNLVSPNQMTIAPGGTLTTLNNRTNSIQYLP